MFPQPLINTELALQRRQDLQRDGAQPLPTTPPRLSATSRRRVALAVLATLAVAGTATSAARAWSTGAAAATAPVSSQASQAGGIVTISPRLSYRDISRFIALRLRGETYTHGNGFNCWAVAGNDQRWALNICVAGPGAPGNQQQ